MKLEGSIFIDRPRQVVFDFISDPGNIARLPGSGDIAQWTSDRPHGLGSTFRFEARLMGLSVGSRGEVTAWDPPWRYARRAINPLLTAEFTFDLEEQADGTKLTSRGTLEFARGPAITAWILGRFIARRFADDIRSIKAILEHGES